MYAKAVAPFARRAAALFGAAALAAGLVACGSEDSMEPTSETMFRAQDCPKVEPSEGDGVSVEGAVGWGDARRDIQEEESRCATEQDMESFFADFEEPEGGGSGPAPTRSSLDGDSGGGGGGLPGFSVAAVDDAADGHLETRAIERDDETYDLPVSVPTPGVTVEYEVGGVAKGCTLSFLGERGGEVVGVTAGHCNKNGDNDSAAWYPNGGTAGARLGTFPSDFCYSRTTCGDYSEIDVDDSLGADGKVAGRYAISGVMDPSDLTPGMELCKYGRVTGESCGKVMGREGNMGRAGIDSRPGDSGAPVYVREGDSVRLVGVHVGSPNGSDRRPVDAVSDFTLAAPTIEDLGIDRVL